MNMKYGQYVCFEEQIINIFIYFEKLHNALQFQIDNKKYWRDS